LAEALVIHAQEHEVIEVEETPHGVKYVLVGSLRTPDGRNPNVRAVWQIDNEREFPRFITARPAPTRRQNVPGT
jgi:hypothetical protein